jgi:hypothetical protein
VAILELLDRVAINQIAQIQTLVSGRVSSDRTAGSTSGVVF